MDLAPDFSEFCALLSDHRVEFVIVGAHALAFHGAPRFTSDLDILVRPTEDNGRRLLQAIGDFGFPRILQMWRRCVSQTSPGCIEGPAILYYGPQMPAPIQAR